MSFDSAYMKSLEQRDRDDLKITSADDATKPERMHMMRYTALNYSRNLLRIAKATRTGDFEMLYSAVTYCETALISILHDVNTLGNKRENYEEIAFGIRRKRKELENLRRFIEKFVKRRPAEMDRPLYAKEDEEAKLIKMDVYEIKVAKSFLNFLYLDALNRALDRNPDLNLKHTFAFS